MAVVEKGPTQVQEVLAKGPVPNPYPTLDLARNDAARLEKIRQVRKLIDEKGIKYIFFQQVSVSGHVNGKGVAATQWERVAEAGDQRQRETLEAAEVSRADRSHDRDCRQGDAQFLRDPEVVQAQHDTDEFRHNRQGIQDK